ncbi:MAG: hypothetical protein AAFQ89_19295, partial [Cyanobacteria bacterium J06626_18]
MSGSSDLQESFNRFGRGHASGNAQVAIAPEQVDLSQVYTLIDGILPFEACLYYQILPLSIEGSRLVIGTVNPDDHAASDYVKKQLSYINYSLTFRTIQSDWHRDLLSKYLSHNAKMRQQSQPRAELPAASAPAQPANATSQSSKKAAKASSPSSPDRNSQTTFIVDQPDEISDYVRSASVRGVATNSVEPELSEALETTLPTAPEPPPSLEEMIAEENPEEEEGPTLVPVPRESAPDRSVEEAIESSGMPEDVPTIIAARSAEAEDAAPVSAAPVVSASPAIAPTEVASTTPTTADVPVTAPADSPISPAVTAPKTENEPTEADSQNSTADANEPLHLQIDEAYRNLGDVDLSTLSPKALMQALLGQVLGEGIGRLYFERPGSTGRILWSKDGILQAVLESIDAQLFQGVINEFKLLTHLSLIAVKKPKQVEIERMYEGERILLRLRVMPNAYGEEATLQVLRGTALRFYQQQLM